MVDGIEGLLGEKAAVLREALRLASAADFSLGADEDSSRGVCDAFVAYWVSRDRLFGRMREIDSKLTALGASSLVNREISDLARKVAEIDRSREGQTAALREFVARGIKEVRDATRGLCDVTLRVEYRFFRRRHT